MATVTTNGTPVTTGGTEWSVGAPPIVESFSSAIQEGTTATSIAVTAPTGITTGDLLVASFRHRGTSTVPPSGWTEQSFINDGNDNKHSLCTKIAVSADESVVDYSFGKSGGSDGLLSVGIARISGHDGTTPLNAIGSLPQASQPVENDQCVAPAVTTTVNDCLVLRLWGASVRSSGGGTGTLAAPGGVTQHWQTGSGSLNRNVVTGGSHTQSTAGDTGTSIADGTSNRGTYRPNAFTVAIAPDDETGWTYVEDIGAEPWVLTNLDPGTEYEAQFRVHDLETGLESVWSNSVIATTEATGNIQDISGTATGSSTASGNASQLNSISGTAVGTSTASGSATVLGTASTSFTLNDTTTVDFDTYTSASTTVNINDITNVDFDTYTSANTALNINDITNIEIITYTSSSTTIGITDNTTVSFTTQANASSTFDISDITNINFDTYTTSTSTFNILDTTTINFIGESSDVPFAGTQFTLSDITTVEFDTYTSVSTTLDISDTTTVDYTPYTVVSSAFDILDTTTVDWATTSITATGFTLLDTTTVDIDGARQSAVSLQVSDVTLINWGVLVPKRNIDIEIGETLTGLTVSTGELVEVTVGDTEKLTEVADTYIETTFSDTTIDELVVNETQIDEFTVNQTETALSIGDTEL